MCVRMGGSVHVCVCVRMGGVCTCVFVRMGGECTCACVRMGVCVHVCV